MYGRGLSNGGVLPLHPFTLHLRCRLAQLCIGTVKDAGGRVPTSIWNGAEPMAERKRAESYVSWFRVDGPHLLCSHPFVSLPELRGNVLPCSMECSSGSGKKATQPRCAPPAPCALHTASPFASSALVHNPRPNPLGEMHFGILPSITAQ